MKTYAMIPINYKYDENDNLLVRRVLIEYKSTTHENNIVDTIYYNDTTLIDVDSYFLDKTKSHQYIFDNDGYTLVDAMDDKALLYVFGGLVNAKRKYHSFSNVSKEVSAILFIAKNDDDARKRFHEREEMR